MVITELFRYVSADAEYRLEIAVFEGVGNFGRKCQVEGDIPYQPFVHG